jgi:hypothetical protein
MDLGDHCARQAATPVEAEPDIGRTEKPEVF